VPIRYGDDPVFFKNGAIWARHPRRKTRRLTHYYSGWLRDYVVTDHDLGFNQRIWQVVAAIPPGRVATYGQVAHKAGMARAARRVGQALRGLPANTRIPWHRVVNAQGHISLPEGSGSHAIQRDRLEQEGVPFSIRGKIDLRQYGW
jgi:methylated-DNA-protein-cysteine methyltransferase-like protein